MSVPVITGTPFLPHALPGFVAWLQQQARSDLKPVIGLHRLVLVAPDYHDTGVRFGHWHVCDESPDMDELKAGRLSLIPGLSELHCKECRRRYPCPAVRLVAARYCDKPGFEDGWKL